MHEINETLEIYLIDHFLSDDECDELIAKSEKIGFVEAKVDINGGQAIMKRIRDNERILYEDQAYAIALWERFSTLQILFA